MTWPTAPLGDVAPAKPLRSADVTDEAPVWQVTLDHIESNTGQLLQKNVRPYGEAGNSTHWFDDRHVLYSKLRPYLNKVFLPDELGLGTTELVPLCPVPGTLDRKYLAYYLRSKKFVNWVSGQIAGAKMPRVSMKVFWGHEILLPPLKEQKRIAAILDKADAIRRKRHQAIQLADEFLRSVFLDMFGDPITNPKGWPIGTLDDAIESIQSGWSAKGAMRRREGNEWGVLKVSSVTSGTFRPEEHKAVNEALVEGKNVIVPEKGDLLFSRANTRELVAAVCLVEEAVERIFLPDKLWKVDVYPNISTREYLRYLISHPRYRTTLTKTATGTSGSMLNISKAKLLEAHAPLPPIELQRDFSKIVWAMYKYWNQYKTILHSSNLLSRALSQCAFRGDL